MIPITPPPVPDPVPNPVAAAETPRPEQTPAQPVAGAPMATPLQSPSVPDVTTAAGGGWPPNYPPFIIEPAPSRRPRALGRFALLFLVFLLIGGVAGALVTRAVNAAGSTPVLGASSAPGVSISASTTHLQQEAESVAAKVEPSVVKITAVLSNGESVGSGDILSADGYIVTNDHVVRGEQSMTVALSTGKTYVATLVGEAAQNDLAVVKIAATGLTPIAVADSSQAQVGEYVMAVGNPLNEGEAATLGTVSGTNATASEAPQGPAGTLTGMIQLTATINPGNSGGALVNLQGQLLGIPTLEYTGSNSGNSGSGAGYAISSNQVSTVSQQLIKYGTVAGANGSSQGTTTGQGFLGIQGADVTAQLAAQDGLSVQSGVLVAGYAADAEGASPAQQAGLRPGDVITAVDGQSVSDSASLGTILTNHAPGTSVKLTVVHGSSQATITVTLGTRPGN